MQTRHIFLAAPAVVLVTLVGVVAAIAADPAPAPPPRIAFLANGIVPADALAAGPIAGQLGAPVFTTAQDTLPEATAEALRDHDPELVIVMGGPVAIADAVVNAVSAATGLPTVAPDPTPAAGVVRAAGDDRFATASIVGDLLAAYAPAYLPVDVQAVDADLFDGRDSSQFANSGDVPVVEMVPASGVPSLQPPDPLPTDRLQAGNLLAVTFTTTTAGRLHITHHSVFDQDCGGEIEWAWLVLDGTPIRNSATRLPDDDTSRAHHTLTGITAQPVPAGDHRVELQAGADPCNPDTSLNSPTATGSVLVLGD